MGSGGLRRIDGGARCVVAMVRALVQIGHARVVVAVVAMGRGAVHRVVLMIGMVSMAVLHVVLIHYCLYDRAFDVGSMSDGSVLGSPPEPNGAG